MIVVVLMVLLTSGWHTKSVFEGPTAADDCRAAMEQYRPLSSICVAFQPTEEEQWKKGQ